MSWTPKNTKELKDIKRYKRLKNKNVLLCFKFVFLKKVK